ncbi:MAG: DUF4349 domain-containing protein [Bacteroidia bacterium]
MNSLKNCSNPYQVRVRHAIALRKNLVLLFSFIFFFVLLSCAPSHKENAFKEKSGEIAQEVNSYSKNIVTDTINGITHNFIRQADIKCKVKDVLSSTKEIEQIATLAGGYTINSELVSNKDYCNSIHFKKDSLNELTYYTLTSNITLRIPNKKLDSVLARITDMAVYIDHRTIKADDVKLKLYANKLAENRFGQFNKRVSKKTDESNARLKQVTAAEETVLETQALSDNKSIESYDLADQVNYSTVMLSLYQSQNVHSTITALPPSVKPYEPSFVYKLGESLLNGFEIITSFILFLMNFWGLFLILFLIYLAVIKVIRHYSKKQVVVSQS